MPRSSDRRPLRALIQALALVALLGACATRPEPAAEAEAETPDEAIEELYEESDGDPLELLNRFVFSFNLAIDTVLLKPAAATYRFLLPVQVRNSVRNFLRNLGTPVVLANDLFQGELERAENTTMRFLINTTAGGLGLFDVADGWGYPYHDEDFGQTLAVHGVGEGFYLVIPIFGPSTLRDGLGRVVDIFLDPLTYVGQAYDAEEALLARTGVDGVDTRSRNIETLEDIQRDAIDFYARIRSLYRQARANEIKNGDPGAVLTPGFSGLDLQFESELDLQYEAAPAQADQMTVGE